MTSEERLSLINHFLPLISAVLHYLSNCINLASGMSALHPESALHLVQWLLLWFFVCFSQYNSHFPCDPNNQLHAFQTTSRRNMYSFLKGILFHVNLTLCQY